MPLELSPLPNIRQNEGLMLTVVYATSHHQLPLRRCPGRLVSPGVLPVGPQEEGTSTEGVGRTPVAPGQVAQALPA